MKTYRPGISGEICLLEIAQACSCKTWRDGVRLGDLLCAYRFDLPTQFSPNLTPKFTEVQFKLPRHLTTTPNDQQESDGGEERVRHERVAEGAPQAGGQGAGRAQEVERREAGWLIA